LLESVVNFSGRNVFSNEEFDHNALFHAPRYLLFTHHSSKSDRTEQVLTRAGGRVEVVASLSQGRAAAAQCGLFTHKSVPVIFEPPCIYEHSRFISHKTALFINNTINVSYHENMKFFCTYMARHNDVCGAWK